jgi:hypothetical protein
VKFWSIPESISDNWEGRSPIASEGKEEREKNASVKKELKPVEENPAQPMLSDFRLYKCLLCGNMVIGYEKERHGEDVHRGV